VFRRLHLVLRSRQEPLADERKHAKAMKGKEMLRRMSNQTIKRLCQECASLEALPASDGLGVKLELRVASHFAGHLRG
jgi:hypothetical protein